MGYQVKILADSIASGVRLTTVLARYPRIVLAEVNTHRMLSRNSASSRAIPVEKNIERVLDDPFVPAAFGENKKGMQAGEDLDADADAVARGHWLSAMQYAVESARALEGINVHKQWANRLLEPWMWIEQIISATEWENFFALRCHPAAAPEIRTIAEMIREAMAGSTPNHLNPGAWHRPMVSWDEVREFRFARGLNDETEAFLTKLSVARSARVSYLTHEGKRDVEADIALYERLRTSGHLSPFEHAAKVATCADGERYTTVDGEPGMIDTPEFVGNYRWPFLQHRKDIPNEAVFVPEAT